MPLHIGFEYARWTVHSIHQGAPWASGGQKIGKWTLLVFFALWFRWLGVTPVPAPRACLEEHVKIQEDPTSVSALTDIMDITVSMVGMSVCVCTVSMVGMSIFYVILLFCLIKGLKQEDTATCVTVEQHYPAILLVLLSNTDNNKTAAVRATTRRDPACPPYDPKELYAMVKLQAPRGGLEGIFGKCQFLEDYEESALSIQVYNCTCFLDYCEDIYLRINPPCTVQLCEVEKDSTP